MKKRILLASATMHGEDEIKYINEAFDTNWITTVGRNIDSVEEEIAKYLGEGCYTVAVSSGTTALHLCARLAGLKYGDKFFCTSMTFAPTAHCGVYQGARPIFIDSEYDTWNMDPECLKKAIKKYPDVKVCIVANLYGTPAKLDEIEKICKENNVILIEDAAESLGASVKNKMSGTFGKYNAISFNGNKIITGSTGGMLITKDKDTAEKARKWSTQARDSAPWYQHSELGYNYRMSNIVAGIVRGQIPHLKEHIAKKKEIYERYKEGFKNLPLEMNPIYEKCNYWLSCILLDKNCKVTWEEIYKKLNEANVESRPIWKPMHMQPYYSDCDYVTINNVCDDIFSRGLCLPSDIKMDKKEQDYVIDIIKSCF